MVKIPSAVLHDRITVEPYLGASAYGPRFDTPRTVRAAVDTQRRVVRTAGGEKVVATATALVRPENTLVVESKVTWRGQPFQVVDIEAAAVGAHDALIELVLGAP